MKDVIVIVYDGTYNDYTCEEQVIDDLARFVADILRDGDEVKFIQKDS